MNGLLKGNQGVAPTRRSVGFVRQGLETEFRVTAYVPIAATGLFAAFHSWLR